MSASSPRVRKPRRLPLRRGTQSHRSRPRLERFEDRVLLAVTFVPTDQSPIMAGSVNGRIEVADLTGNDISDLIILNNDTGEISILLGDGDGNFEQAAGSPIMVGGTVSGVAVGDVDGNGFADLVVTSFSNSTATVLLGGGDGTFTVAAGSPIALGTGPSDVVMADFNGNTVLDLAIPSATTNDVRILLGNGDGTFTEEATESPVAAGTGASRVVSGDFNDNGFADLAVSNFGDATVTILLGNGDGTFTQATDSPILVDGSPLGLISVDLDNDGVLDLVVTSAFDNTVVVLLGNGDGTFTEASGSPIPVGDSPRSVAAADFDGDGMIDLVVSNFNSQDLTILLGQGDGTFIEADESPFSIGSFTEELVTGDFDGNGRPDLAVLAGLGVTVLLNDPMAIPDPLMVTINDVTELEGDEGTTDFVFTVSLNFDPGVPVTVNFATAPGSAIGGVDYEIVSGTLTFDGTTEQTITVPVLGNTDEQPDRVFFVTLSDPEVEDGSAITLERSQGVGTIWDDDSTIQFTVDTLSVSEGGLAQITVFRTGIGALNRPASAVMTVGGGLDDSATSGDDFSPFTTTLNFGPNESVKGFAIPIVDDNLIEPAETFSIVLSDFVGVNEGDPSTLVVTIAASTVSILPIDPSNRFEPLDSITVEFSEPIDPSTFTVDDLMLMRNGMPVDLPEGVTIEPLDDSNRRFLVSGLEGATGAKGRYEIVVDFSGISDPFGNFGEGISSAMFSIRQDRVAADFDGDGITDVGVYYYDETLGTGRFEILMSSTGELMTFDMGGPNDFPVIGDFDGDGRSDFAVYGFDASVGFARFRINHSSTGETVVMAFGGPNDFPIAGDYDGDGITDLAVYGFSPDNGFSRFAILHSGGSPIMPDGMGNTPQGAFPLAFGGFDDFPIAADYDGDGITDLAVYGFSPDNGFSRFAILHSGGSPIMPDGMGNTPQGAFPLAFGGRGDAPVVADFDGDGFADLAVFGYNSENETSRYAILLSEGSPITTTPDGATPEGAFLVEYGREGDIPIGGDFDGNGETDLAVFSAGRFLIQSGFDGEAETTNFGRTGDIPLPPSSGLFTPIPVMMGSSNGTGEGLAARRRSSSPWAAIFDRALADLTLDS